MRRLVVVLFAVFECLVGTVGFCNPTSKSEVHAPLTREECVRLVRREMPGFKFSENSSMDAGLIASCTAGKEFYSRSLFDCMFSAKYIDPLDCEYKARGVDRSKQSPGLAARDVIGDDGGYEAYVSGIVKSVYQGQDPRTTIDPQLLKRYLTKRDDVIVSLGEVPPDDNKSPSQIAASQEKVADRIYWTVRENFTDLQLVKIIREDDVGVETVFCARFGSTKTLRTDNGLCAFLINKHWHVVLPD